MERTSWRDLKEYFSSLQVKVEVEAGRNIPANDMVSIFPIGQLMDFIPNDNNLILEAMIIWTHVNNVQLSASTGQKVI